MLLAVFRILLLLFLFSILTLYCVKGFTVKPKQNHGNENKLLLSLQPNYLNSKCNSERLRKVIKMANGSDVTTLKRNIQFLAETRLQARFNVICAGDDFSYITNTEEYCQETVGSQTCYIFRQFNRSGNLVRYHQRRRKVLAHRQ